MFHLACYLLFLSGNVASARITAVYPSLPFNPDQLQTGDIILRQGHSTVSQLIMVADQSISFSHSGIIYRSEDNTIFVFHITPYEEGDSANTVPIMRMDAIEAFLRMDRARLAAVYRLRSTSPDIPLRAKDAAIALFKQRPTFDFDLDLETSDRLYCTELVWRAYLTAGIDLVDGAYDHLSIPFYTGAYILPSRLAKSRWLEEVVVIGSSHP